MKPTQDQSSLIIASVVASVMIHFAFVGGVVGYVVYSEPDEKETPEEVVEPEEPIETEVVVSGEQPYKVINDSEVVATQASNEKSDEELREELIAVELAKLEEKEKEKEPNSVVDLNPRQSFERTAAHQVSDEVPENPDHFGVHDTKEQTTVKATVDAPERIAIDGKKPDDRFQNAFESTFKEGNPEDEGGGSTAAAEGNPESEKLNKLIENQDEVLKKLNPEPIGDDKELKKGVEEAIADKGEKDRDQLKVAAHQVDESESLKVADKIAKNESNNAQEEMRAKKGERKGSDLPETNETPKKVEDLAQTKKGNNGIDPFSDPFAKAAGMTSEMRKHRVTGSIGRNGVTVARNVAASIRGKYTSDALRTIEQHWQKMFVEYQDRVAYGGTVFVVINISADGKIVSKKIDGDKYSQRSIALLALKKSKLPSMPAKLKKEQQGAPLEIRFSILY